MSLIEKALAKSTGLNGITTKQFVEQVELVPIEIEWLPNDPNDDVLNVDTQNVQKQSHWVQSIPFTVTGFVLIIMTAIFLARSESQLFVKTAAQHEYDISEAGLSKDSQFISKQGYFEDGLFSSNDHFDNEAEGFRLTGTIYFGASGNAIINDALFRPGDEIVEGVTVKDVQRRTVLIDYKGRELALSI